MAKEQVIEVVPHKYSGRWVVKVCGVARAIFDTESEANTKADSLRAAQGDKLSDRITEAVDSYQATEEPQRDQVGRECQAWVRAHYGEGAANTMGWEVAQKMGGNMKADMSALAASPSPQDEQISPKDWDELCFEICKVFAAVTDDEDWKDADISNMEEFDPWDALKQLAEHYVSCQCAPKVAAERDEKVAMCAEHLVSFTDGICPKCPAAAQPAGQAACGCSHPIESHNIFVTFPEHAKGNKQCRLCPCINFAAAQPESQDTFRCRACNFTSNDALAAIVHCQDAHADSILITREQLENFHKSARELQLRFGVRSGECRTCDLRAKHSLDCPIPELNRTVANLGAALGEKK